MLNQRLFKYLISSISSIKCRPESTQKQNRLKKQLNDKELLNQKNTQIDPSTVKFKNLKWHRISPTSFNAPSILSHFPTKLVEKKESIRKIVSKSQRYYSDTWKGATHPLVEDTSITPSTRSRGKFERAYIYK